MRVFVTGATGYIGSAVVRALAEAGHEVGGLVRDTRKEEAVRALGAVPIYGHLQDPETYQHFAAESRAVVHLAFESPELDRLAVEALLGSLIAEGEPKLFVYTSGVWVLGHAREAGEGAPVDPPALMAWRPAVENRVLGHTEELLATAVVRPGLVYGGRRGLFAPWFASAVQDREITVIGDGTNFVPTVHRRELAELYRLVVERDARGIFHGVEARHAMAGELARACALAVGPDVTVRTWPLEDARARLGGFADAMALDQRVLPVRSHELGWRPRHPPLVESAADVLREWRS